jgi:hypothetical protein
MDVKFDLLVYGRERNFENKMPRKFFIPKSKKALGGWMKQLHEFHKIRSTDA